MSEPYRFQIMPEEKVIFAKHFGEIKLGNIVKLSQAVNENSCSLKHMNVLVDCRNCGLDLNAHDLQVVADMLAKKAEQNGYYTEILLISGMLSQGFSRMLGAKIDELDIRFEVLWDNDPELEEKVCELLNLEQGFVFPDFLSLPFRPISDSDASRHSGVCNEI